MKIAIIIALLLASAWVFCMMMWGGNELEPLRSPMREWYALAALGLVLAWVYILH